MVAAPLLYDVVDTLVVGGPNRDLLLLSSVGIGNILQTVAASLLGGETIVCPQRVKSICFCSRPIPQIDAKAQEPDHRHYDADPPLAFHCHGLPPVVRSNSIKKKDGIGGAGGVALEVFAGFFDGPGRRVKYEAKR
jgi:hypothetical protein